MAAALRAVLAYEQELKTQVDDVQVSCRQIADVLNNNELQQEEDDGKLQFVPDIVKGLAQDAAETEGSIAVMMTALKAIEQRVKQVQTQKATAADDQEVRAVTVLYLMYTMLQARLANAAGTTASSQCMTSCRKAGTDRLRSNLQRGACQSESCCCEHRPHYHRPLQEDHGVLACSRRRGR
jgi:trehalose/maltose hydrolase-like predicted phosphorylase